MKLMILWMNDFNAGNVKKPKSWKKPIKTGFFQDFGLNQGFFQDPVFFKYGCVLL